MKKLLISAFAALILSSCSKQVNDPVSSAQQQSAQQQSDGTASTTINGDLYGTDYSDKFEYTRTARTYNYELTASGGGKVSFKVEQYAPPLLGESGSGHWYTIEDKSQVTSGTTSNGSFTVTKTILSSSTSTDQSQIRLTFSRKALSAGVTYKLYFEPK